MKMTQKEEAETCIKIAHAYIRIGNLTKAQELAEKAGKLFPSSKVKNLKKKIAKKRKAASSSQEKSQTEFSQEHVNAVNQVNNCKTLYEMLQVNKDFTDADITKAFRRIALTLHPDKNYAPGAEEAFKSMNNAHNLLRKLVSRRIYNNFLDAVATNRFYGHDASHYPPKWWCDASDKNVEKMEFCLSSGYKCQNADCERQRKNEQESQQREQEAKKRSEEEARRRQEEARKRSEEEARRRQEEARKRSEEEARRRQEEARKRSEEKARRRQEEARWEEEARRQRSEEQANNREEEEARRWESEAMRKRFEEEERKRLEEEERMGQGLTVLDLAIGIKRAYIHIFRHRTARWMALFAVSCYYFPLLRRCALDWPCRIIFCTRLGQLGLLGCLLWLPFMINNQKHK